MAGNELLATQRFLNLTLTLDAGVIAIVGSRVYESVPPQIDPDDPDGLEPAYPMLLYHVQRGYDTLAAAAKRQFTIVDMVVKGVAREQGAASLGGLNSRIDALLKQPGTSEVTLSFPGVAVEVYTILGGFRTTPLSYPEEDAGGAGIRYDYLGGVYRVYVRQKS